MIFWKFSKKFQKSKNPPEIFIFDFFQKRTSDLDSAHQIWLQSIPISIFLIFWKFWKSQKKGVQKWKKKFFQCKSILIHFFFLPWKFQLDRTIISRGWNFHFWFFENDPPEPPSGTPHEKFLKISFLPKSSKLWFRKSQELSGGVYLNFFWEKSKKREGGADSAPPQPLYG